ncbi:DUF5995 family protein [Plantactinospora sp. KLBMP9567]|uniref:DUF5995 family protein n=1 Tax=Plantactinospora sp. KLBMP9567 TaxID=3085900 RepID=UPI002981BF3B|nr:DUF5995 family protein [Plantactinospora sp. KLBMP9567]MDW5327632.1 DUF5995 family protein [Plantactinospora sp. KLBMP9567]
MGRWATARTLLAAALGVTGVLPPAPPAGAAPSPYRPDRAAVWAAVPDTCPDGGAGCVDDTIARLRERFATLGRSCDHHATFTLAYLRTTQGFKWGRDQPGYFVDNAWVNREGALFAEYYYRAYDDWAAGRRSAVPGAWLAALDAARSRRLSGAGDLMLGMNAHINRDLPYVLERVGLTAPDGSSRKPDHDRVNEILAAVIDPLLAELIARLDREGFDTGIPTGAALGLLVSWREQAWRNAVRLAGARTPFARTLVELDIESSAVAIATGLATLTSYVPPFTGPGPRAAYCAERNGTPPPVAYPFGVPPAY